ncbi:hypothetical protein [Edaphobacillus lindanitolerans]|uniref:Uncharacterized protein n=1 Tax=Edaphobacillus lindanitolerans TaxID=550447 RepID=A0A1U7PPD0_9BACI|nr:hypothetical protein [Edaphobacillus lindanitolerans]SIT87357.1 hypothetical protein SAMN05428946_2075 [Edaphobacillus lindanitolerans]
MARNRSKEYKHGERINIYLSRDLTPEFIDWINTQSDLSNFFLYAAQQLYRQTGFVDVAEVMPRKINFELDGADYRPPFPQSMPPAFFVEEEPEPEKPKEPAPAWGALDDFDDPFA